jgi:hypothetical protein
MSLLILFLYTIKHLPSVIQSVPYLKPDHSPWITPSLYKTGVYRGKAMRYRGYIDAPLAYKYLILFTINISISDKV